MGVDLGLQHLVFQILLALLVLQAAGQQALHVAGQMVDPPADVPQLVGPLDGVVDGKVALADLVDAVAEGGHRLGDDGVQPAHQQRAHGPQQQDAQPDQQQVDHPLAEEGALGEKLDQLGVPALQGHPHAQKGAPVAGDAGNMGGGAGHAGGAVGLQVQAVFQQGQVAAVQPPDLVPHPPVEDALVRHDIVFGRAGDDRGVQPQIDPAGMGLAGAGADLPPQHQAGGAGGQKRVLRKGGAAVRPLEQGDGLGVQPGGGGDVALLQKAAGPVGDEKADDPGLQLAGQVPVGKGIVSRGGQGAAGLAGGQVAAQGAVGGGPVQQPLGRVQAGLDRGGHLLEVELHRAEGGGADVGAGQGKQDHPHQQADHRGEQLGAPQDLPAQGHPADQVKGHGLPLPSLLMMYT